MIFVLRRNRKKGVIKNAGESQTFTLTTSGPENLWMGDILGTRDRFVLVGELIQIIDESDYNLTIIDGTTFFFR